MALALIVNFLENACVTGIDLSPKWEYMYLIARELS
jgi:hypothetical protein